MRRACERVCVRKCMRACAVRVYVCACALTHAHTHIQTLKYNTLTVPPSGNAVPWPPRTFQPEARL